MNEGGDQLGTKRLILLGGFLGSGKTTTLTQIARRYVGQGKRVVFITNDQGDTLVDTELVRQLGFAAAEVTGGCFCCRFDDLVQRADELIRDLNPDVILAEPVGSCTDLLATVVHPMRELHGDRFSVAPLVVVVDPIRALAAYSTVVSGESDHHSAASSVSAVRPRLSEKVTYIFRMQQQEADCIAINKVDLLTADQRRAVEELMRSQFPAADVLSYSARSERGLERVKEYLENRQRNPRVAPSVDYDVYAEGEAELGWLNASVSMDSPAALELSGLVMDLAQRTTDNFRSLGIEIAHAKMLLRGDRDTAIANIVSSDRPAQLTRASSERSRSLDLLANLRVQGEPADLEETLERSLAEWAAAHRLAPARTSGVAFKPGRPVPTHRISEGAATD